MTCLHGGVAAAEDHCAQLARYDALPPTYTTQTTQWMTIIMQRVHFKALQALLTTKGNDISLLLACLGVIHHAVHALHANDRQHMVAVYTMLEEHNPIQKFNMCASRVTTCFLLGSSNIMDTAAGRLTIWTRQC